MPTPLKIVFAGTPDFSVPALDALLASDHQVVAVYTQPDRPAGRGRRLRLSPVKQRAVEHQLTVMQPSSLRDADVQHRLAQWRADVMVVVAYGLLLPAAVLAMPAMGCINIHASLLPRWRGAAPIQRALLAGDAETGVTIMQMEVGLDTGAALAVASTPIGATESGGDLHDRLAVLGAKTLVETLDALQRGQLRPRPQDEAQACYAAKLTKAEAWLDWRRSAEELSRQVRAFDPWPVAQTRLGAQTLRVWSAQVLNEDHQAEPGTVLRSAAGGIDVACGRACLRLLRVQLPGGKPMTAEQFVAARAIEGVRLGLPPS